ncbi:hypothetical protein B0F87_11297 [Methylobacter tundripaludum]|uniref:Uncharacterized protein n=1 Tax=Methylobacter tundripaludum TaxID=173365 RepID=A0A2S6H9E8_9GAMM|nr:hypothetical protein B0F87_11297 [Methylobacter tundripaludum]
MRLIASSQAPAWEFSVGSSSFPSREAATAWTQEVEQRREPLPRASSSGFLNWSLETSDKSVGTR